MAASGLVVFFAKSALLAAVFCVPYFGFHAVLDRRNLSYRDHVGSIVSYFLVWSLIDLWLFRSDLARIPTNSDVVLPAIIFFATLLVTVIIYASGKTTLPDVTSRLQSYGSAHNEFVQLDYRYLVAKSADVLYQQVGLILAVLLLDTLLTSTLLLAFVTAGLFGVSHVLVYVSRYRNKRVHKARVLSFSIASFLGGWLMPVLILLVPFGFVYSFCVHELYYPFVGAGFRYAIGKQEHESHDPARSKP